jgi:hypothetical protein
VLVRSMLQEHILKDGPETAASSLYHTLEQQLDWHKGLFGEDESGTPFIGQCINQFVTRGEFCVRLIGTTLSSDNIDIRLDNVRITHDVGRLTHLAQSLEKLWEKKSAPAVHPVNRPLIAAKKPLRIGVLLSAALSQPLDIEKSLRSSLTVAEAEFGRMIDVFPKPGQVASLKRLRQEGVRAPFDCYITVGSSAAAALKTDLGEQYGEKPVIFLGVTYPKNLLIVDSLQGRTDRRQVAGVAYGSGVEDIAYQIDRFFLRKPQYFLYKSSIRVDKDAARQLEKSELHTLERLQMIRRPGLPALLRDMPEDYEQAVCWGWYSLGLMYEDRDCRKRLENRYVVATTRANVERGYAAMGISADDREIGSTGAQLIIDHFQKQIDLGRLDIVIPKVYPWVNREVAAKFGIVVPQQLIEEAKERYGNLN